MLTRRRKRHRVDESWPKNLFDRVRRRGRRWHPFGELLPSDMNEPKPRGNRTAINMEPTDRSGWLIERLHGSPLKILGGSSRALASSRFDSHDPGRSRQRNQRGALRGAQGAVTREHGAVVLRLNINKTSRK